MQTKKTLKLVMAALADLFSGYVAFLPTTFLIKGFMAVIMGLFIKDLSKNNAVKTAIIGAIAECFMIAGYFFFEAVVMGFGLGVLYQGMQFRELWV